MEESLTFMAALLGAGLLIFTATRWLSNRHRRRRQALIDAAFERALKRAKKRANRRLARA